jgi:hypothetical protein
MRRARLFRQNYADRCEELVREIEWVEGDVSQSLDLPPAWDPLKGDMKRWMDALRTLMDGISLKGELPEDNDGGETDTVFTILTAGMDDTVDSIRDALTNPPSQQSIAILEHLRMRVALHAESTALITRHLDR